MLKRLKIGWLQPFGVTVELQQNLIQALQSSAVGWAADFDKVSFKAERNFPHERTIISNSLQTISFTVSQPASFCKPREDNWS